MLNIIPKRIILGEGLIFVGLLDDVRTYLMSLDTLSATSFGLKLDVSTMTH